MHLSGLDQSTVKTFQQQLNARGFGPLVVDGILGPKTSAAVRAFQQKAGLKVDGIIGPQTTAALMAAIITDNTPLLKAMTQPTASGVAYETKSPPALPTGSVSPLPSAPTGTVYTPPPQIIEIKAPQAGSVTQQPTVAQQTAAAAAPVPQQGGIPLPLILAGLAAAAFMVMG